MAIAGGGSESTNVILGSAIADISGGTLGTAANPVGAVTVSASSTAAITATVVGVAGSIAFGSSTGVAVALGVAVARNFIGWGTAVSPPSDYTLHPDRQRARHRRARASSPASAPAPP